MNNCIRCHFHDKFMATLSYAIGLTANEMKDGNFLIERIRQNFMRIVEKFPDLFVEFSSEEITKQIDVVLSSLDLHRSDVLVDPMGLKNDRDVVN